MAQLDTSSAVADCEQRPSLKKTMNSSAGDRTPYSFESSRAIPLAGISMVGTEFAWYHAVAIVRQLVDQLIPPSDDLPGENIPDVAGLSLHANGDLRAEVKPGGSTPPVVALGSLLHHLLIDRDQPAALRLLVLQASAATPTISLTELVYQLGQWERPNRRTLLNAVYAMLSEVPAQTPADVRLPAQAALSPAEQLTAAQREPRRRPWSPPRVLAGLAVGGGLIVGAVLLFAGLGGASGSASALSSRSLASVGAALAPVLSGRLNLFARGRVIVARSPGADVVAVDPAVVVQAPAKQQPALPKRAVVSPRPSSANAPPRTARMASAENEFRRAQALLGNHQYAEAKPASTACCR